VIVSTQKIVDTITGTEYNGLVDDDLLSIMNKQDYQIILLKEENNKLKNRLKDLRIDY